MNIGGHVYGAYGNRTAATAQARTAYAGQVRDPGTGSYLLGERIYDPSLRRFLKPDSRSPFDKGGLNRYAYCGGDPIGRIDPSGRTWWSWVASTLDRMSFPITHVKDTSGAKSSFTTPTLLASTLPAETAPVWAAIKRNAPESQIAKAITAYGNKRVPISGPGSHQTEVYTLEDDSLGVQWPRIGDTGSLTVFTRDERTIQFAQGPHVFRGDRQRESYAARGVTYPQWTTETNARGGVHIATTTTLNLAYLRPLKNYISRTYPGKPVSILAGAHGNALGNVWGADGTRRHLEQKFYDSVGRKAREMEWSVTMMNYSDVDSAQFDSMLANDEGVVVHYTCFGAADRRFMDAFQIEDITLRMLPPFPVSSSPTP